MSICKLSLAKSRSLVDPGCGTGASEILRNEAYVEVRRSDLPC
jgi:precorrin-6B methylase 2